MSDLQEVITAAVVGVAIVALLIWQQLRYEKAIQKIHYWQDNSNRWRLMYKSFALEVESHFNHRKQARDSKGRFIKAEK